MVYVVTIFLALSLLLYTLLGGADFGAGILEFFRRKSKTGISEELTNKAIGPVWEANHMWLIIMIVILFMGFPVIYSTISVFLHIPVTALLVGIVLRGCFFTFRHYDLIQDESAKVYSFIFAVSSVITSFFIGLTAGAMKLGRIVPEATGFFEAYIQPWFNLFSFSVGIFTIALFSFIAAVYLIGETPVHVNPRLLIRQAQNANISIVAAGAMVFAAAWLDEYDLLGDFIDTPSTAAALALATLLLPFLWRAIKLRQVIASRFLVGTQVTCVLFAWLWADFPIVVHFSHNAGLNIFDASAPEPTMWVLGLSLLIGAVFILPALGYLLYTFKRE